MFEIWNLRRRRLGVSVINFLKLLDRLEDLVERSFRVPLLGRILVNEEEFFVLSNKIRSSLPEEIRQAIEINKNVQRIEGEAKERAERIIKEAEEKTESLINEDRITKEAESKAKEIRSQAEKEGKEVRRGADEYAGRILTSLESNLSRILEQVKRGQESLREKEEGEGG